MEYLLSLCPTTAPSAKSLASHINSNGRFQSGETITCAVNNFYLILLKESRLSLLKENVFSLINKLHNGFAFFGKSLINR